MQYQRKTTPTHREVSGRGCEAGKVASILLSNGVLEIGGELGPPLRPGGIGMQLCVLLVELLRGFGGPVEAVEGEVRISLQLQHRLLEVLSSRIVEGVLVPFVGADAVVEVLRAKHHCEVVVCHLSDLIVIRHLRCGVDRGVELQRRRVVDFEQKIGWSGISIVVANGQEAHQILFFIDQNGQKDVVDNVPRLCNCIG